MNEKMMKTLGFIIVGFVVFILILFFIASCSNHKYTYESLEKEMLKIAKKHFENNKEDLPALDKDSKIITLKDMINNKEIDDVTELFDDKEMSCDGSVTVTNNNGYYLYTPYLSCKDKYETKYLRDKIIEDSLVTQGVGLYQMKNTYVMRGEVKNNYVKYGKNLYRIIRINEDGSLYLIETKASVQKSWDNRYNAETRYNSGINEYEYDGLDSRFKEFISTYYSDNEAWPEELKAYIPTFDLCIGKRSKADITSDGSTECSEKLANQTLGSLAIYEYLQASLDNDCKALTDSPCRNYNWIATIENSFWSITADAETSANVYVIFKNPSSMIANSYASIFTTFNLTDKAIYVDGDGTKEKPYTFR